MGRFQKDSFVWTGKKTFVSPFFSSKSQIYLLGDSIVNIVVILATKNSKKRQESAKRLTVYS